MTAAPPSRRPAAAGGAVLGLLAALVLAACGIPTGAAKAIPKGDVPFHLLEPGTTSTTAPAQPPVAMEPVFMVAPDQQHLLRVVRVVPVPATLTVILGALLEGPTSTEQAFGVTSFVSGNRTEVSASVSPAGVATVSFTVNPLTVVGPNQALGIAQIVYTATEQPGVSSVVFHIGGVPADVPVASGAQVPGPVSRSDYAPQAPVA